MFLNCYSVVSLDRRFQLSDFLVRNGIKVALLSETFLKPHIKFYVPGFKIFRNDSISHGGGTAIIVADQLVCRQVSTPRSSCFKDPTAVRIVYDDGNYVFISV